MISEFLTNAVLAETALQMEKDCKACSDAPSDKEGKKLRTQMHTMLRTLGRLWDNRGDAGSLVTDAMIQSCDACLAGGRKQLSIYAKSCSLPRRLPENPKIKALK